MTWAQVKQAAQDARSNPEQYYGMLGTYKELKIPRFDVGLQILTNSNKTYFDEEYVNVYVVDVAPTLSVGGVGLVLAARLNAIYWQNQSSMSSGNLYYSDSYCYKNCFRSGSVYLNNVNAEPENENFVSYLINANYKAVNGCSYIDYNQGERYTIYLTPNSVGSYSSFIFCPSYLELFDENLESFVGWSFPIEENNIGFTFDQILKNSFIKQCSMGFMKNVVKSTPGNDASGYTPRDCLAVTRMKDGSGDYDYTNLMPVCLIGQENNRCRLHQSNSGGWSTWNPPGGRNYYLSRNDWFLMFM